MLLLFPTRPSFFFFNDTATTEIYTLSLHDALPISRRSWPRSAARCWPGWRRCRPAARPPTAPAPTSARCRSEEHTSELQSQPNLVCRLLLEKKKKMLPCGAVQIADGVLRSAIATCS